VAAAPLTTVRSVFKKGFEKRPMVLPIVIEM
jgi:hypothetical protein